ncbi:amidohydrolase [Moorella naiadis]|uniref:amidohydrolase n=1 Tax=Moorella naiadis (nom. illeg.) TaxID=3093670 RepID=UPI003D9C94FE
MAILIKNARYLIQNAEKILENVDLLIEGNQISLIGPDLTAGRDTTIIEATGKVVMPGLINAHTHLYQCFLKARRDDLPFKEWCEEVTFPFTNVIQEDYLQRREATAGYYWSLLGAMEMIKGGITCCINMDKTLPSVFQAWLNIGFRGVGAITAVNRWVPKELSLSDEQRKAEILSYIKEWHQVPAESPLVQIFMAPSTPFACTKNFLQWLGETAITHDLGLQVHVSENSRDVTLAEEESGLTPLAYLDSLGLLQQHFTAVHCVYLTAAEMDLARERGVIPVYNPKSNAKLGSGIAPVAEMLARGLTVAIGTDGAASNDLLDMFEEMRAATLFQKARYQDASLLPAGQVLQMATVNGARAARINAGELLPGKLADVIILGLDGPHRGFLHDLLQNIVYCAKAADVETTIINGRIIMQDRQLLTVDEAEAKRRAMEIADDIFTRAKGKMLAAEF